MTTCCQLGPRAVLGAAVLLAVLAGCGPSVGSVDGRVLLDGQPLSAGTGTFVDANGHEGTYRIRPDGEDRIAEFPVGNAPIWGTRQPRAPFGKAPSSDPRPAVLPDRYQDPERSGLELVVHPGSQTYNIRLESSPRR